MFARPSLRFARCSLLALALLVTQESRGAADVGSRVEPIIYGTDDRTDVYAETDPAWRSLATESIVSLMEPNALLVNGTSFSIEPLSLADALGVCSDQRFVDQPSAAFCSGTLIDDDLVLTAGHCVSLPYDPTTPESAPTCGAQRFVFDYYETAPSTLATVTLDDVYLCRRVVVRHMDATLDYAIVQLDRPVVGRVPVTVAASASPLAVGTAITVIGSPEGLPIKIAGNATVTSPGPATHTYFVGDPDTFGGSSGSGVFDDSHELLGVLVRGGEDYVQRTGASCYEANVVPTTDAREEMTYVSRPLDALCALDYPSERLCGIAPSCGDGFCTAGETTGCARDCNGPVCGDGVCAAGESNATCSLDCAPVPATKSGGCAVAFATSSRDGSYAAALGTAIVCMWAATRGLGRRRRARWPGRGR